MSLYAVTKLAGEGLCRSFWEAFGLESVALHYSNVLGPRQDPLSQYAARYPELHHRADGRTAPQGVPRRRPVSREFAYVGNIVEGNVLAMAAEGSAAGW
jgi:nucleoside-diphosphate-sugar epimerase